MIKKNALAHVGKCKTWTMESYLQTWVLSLFFLLRVGCRVLHGARTNSIHCQSWGCIVTTLGFTPVQTVDSQSFSGLISSRTVAKVAGNSHMPILQE